MIDSLRVSGAVLAALAMIQPLAAQTRERGPWWPSVHGQSDQAGASNYVTPAKILTGYIGQMGHSVRCARSSGPLRPNG
jgi:hypothetical protein